MSSVRTSRPVPPGQQVRARYRQVRTQAAATATEVLGELRQLTGHPPPEALGPAAGQPAGKLRPRLQQVAQGLLQPLHAARLLIGDRELLGQALLPALLLLAFCLGVGFLHAPVSDEPGFWWPMLKTAFSSFAVLAPVPSIVMANHYGRLCAQAHERLQLGPCQPRRRPLIWSAILAGRQLVAVAVAIVPLTFALHFVPWLGARVAQGLLLLWALHWIVVEALDDGGVDTATAAAPAEPPELSELPPADWLPWFLWPVDKLAGWLPALLGAPLRFIVRRLRWLCAPWHKEITLIEQNLPLMLGFATTTAALLCTPVLNLVFRPITVVAAVRLHGHLRRARQAPLLAAPPPVVDAKPH